MDDGDTTDNDYIAHLTSEIEHAHRVLDKYGVGKKHWSLAGRIEGLVYYGIIEKLIKDDGTLEHRKVIEKVVRELEVKYGQHTSPHNPLGYINTIKF